MNWKRKGKEETIESHYQSAIATSIVLLLRMNHSLSRQHFGGGGDGGKLICWPIVISQNVPLQPRDIIAFDRAAIQLHSSLFESIYSCPLRIESVKRVFVRPSFTTIDKGWTISLLFTACLNHLASQMKSAMQTTHTHTHISIRPLDDDHSFGDLCTMQTTFIWSMAHPNIELGWRTLWIPFPMQGE